MTCTFFSQAYTDNRKAETVFDREKDHKAAADIETECAVLLENRGVLPLKKEQKVVYIGEFAKKPRYQGGGSSHINTDSVVSALETAVRKGRAVEYVKGFSSERDEMTEEDLKQAVVWKVLTIRMQLLLPQSYLFPLDYLL